MNHPRYSENTTHHGYNGPGCAIHRTLLSFGSYAPLLRTPLLDEQRLYTLCPGADGSRIAEIAAAKAQAAVCDEEPHAKPLQAWMVFREHRAYKTPFGHRLHQRPFSLQELVDEVSARVLPISSATPPVEPAAVA
jgi:hypothetical protein